MLSRRADLVIEVDGGQHSQGDLVGRGQGRDAVLLQRGLRVLSYADHDVLANDEGELEDAWRNA